MTTHLAILGATGHIGRALADLYATREGFQLARSRAGRTRGCRLSRAVECQPSRHGRSRFARRRYRRQCRRYRQSCRRSDPAREIYQLTMEYEDRIERALADNPGRLTVFISSGAAYGRLNAPARAGHADGFIPPTRSFQQSGTVCKIRCGAAASRASRAAGSRYPHLRFPQSSPRPERGLFMSGAYRALLNGNPLSPAPATCIATISERRSLPRSSTARPGKPPLTRPSTPIRRARRENSRSCNVSRNSVSTGAWWTTAPQRRTACGIRWNGAKLSNSAIVPPDRASKWWKRSHANSCQDGRRNR